MTPITLGVGSVVALLVLILSGIPIGFALAGVSFVGLWLVTGKLATALSLLGSTSFEAIRQYVFAVAPMFMLMGAFMTYSRAAEDLYRAAHLVLRRIPGGLAIATVIANAVFAAVTGISVASAAVFAKVSVPQMVQHGYSKRLALGSVAGSSILGMLIPPSLLMILYGILTNVSIGRLFIAGIIPGLLLSAIYAVGIVMMVRLKPALIMSYAPVAGGSQESAVTAEQVGESDEGGWRTLLLPLPVVILAAVVIFGIWGGAFTPTEASAIGALGAWIVAAFLGMNREQFVQSLLETGRSAGSIMFLLIAAQMYSRMLASTGVVRWFSDLILGTALTPTLTVLVFILIWLVLGTIIDSSSIILLTVPLTFPIALALDLDPLWFGIVMIVAIEMGLLTPPFGMVPFSMSAVLGKAARVEEIFSGSLPFIAMMVLLLGLLLLFPSLATWLPQLVLG